MSTYDWEEALEMKRVLTTGIPGGMLHEILARTTDLNPHMKVVASTTGEQLHHSVSRYEADVVILGLNSDELPKVCTELLDEFPETTVVAVSANGRRVAIHVNDIGPTELLEMIQAARRAP